MRRNDELHAARLGQLGHLAEQDKLPLRGERSLWFIHQDESRIEPCGEHLEERFAVRPGVERTTTVTRVGVAPKIGIGTTLLEQRSEVSLKFSAEEISVWRPTLKSTTDTALDLALREVWSQSCEVHLSVGRQTDKCTSHEGL